MNLSNESDRLMENNYSELIDRFLRNQMTEEEMQDFKRQIETNSELKQQVRDHVLLIRAIRETQAEKDKQIIDSVLRESQKPRRTLGSYARYFAVAASLVLAVVVGHDLFYLYSANQLAGELSSKTIAQYQSMTMRGVDDEDVASLDTLFRNVDQGENLDETIDKLSALYAISEDEYVDAVDDYTTQIGMELAIAYHKNGEKDKAVSVLEALIAENQENKDAIRLRKFFIGKFLNMQ